MNKVRSEISKWLSGTHNFNSDTLFDIERILNIKLINLSETSKEQVLRFQINVSQKTEKVKETSCADFISGYPYLNYIQNTEPYTLRKLKSNTLECQAI